MDFLLSDRLAPITSSFGFIEKESNDLVDCYQDWIMEINARLDRSKRSKFSFRKVTGSLETVLLNLVPLSAGGSDRNLFIPTRSKWTAFYENGVRGTDPSPISYLAERCNCRSIWIVATPFIQKNEESRGFEGALIFELYGPENSGTMTQNIIRSIRLEKDIGKWSFSLTGAPLPFENLKKYESRYKKDKFTLDLMNEYLLELGIDAFQESFYLPTGTKAFFTKESTKYKLIHLSLYKAKHYYDRK